MTEDTFASRFKAVLERKQIKLKQVAEAVGISSPAVHKWTRGGEIDYENLRKLANFLEVNWVWLRYGDQALRDLENNLPASSPMTDIRRKHLSEILENEARMKLAQEVSGVVTWEWNILTDAISYSANAEKLFGRHLKTMDDFWAVLHPEDVEAVSAAINQSLSAGTPYEWDFRVLMPNGETHWVSSRATLVFDPEKRPIKMVGVSIDITGRKRAEENLRKSEAMLTKAQEIAHIGSWDWDVPVDDLICSDEWYRIFGLKPQAFKVTYESFLEMLHPEDCAFVNQTVQSALHGGEGYNIDYRIIWPDGSVRVIHEEAKTQYDRHGRAVRMTGTTQDITEQRQTERRLRESEEHFRSVFEQAAVGMAYISLDGHWLRANQKLCEILGYPAEELMKHTFQEMTYQDDLEENMQQYRRLLAGEIATYTMEKRFLRRNGAIMWANVTTSLGREPSNQAPSHLITVIEDITERRQAMEALKDSTQRLQLALASGGLGELEVNPRTGQVMCSDAAIRLMGLANMEEGRDLATFLSHVHPEDRKLRERMVKEGVTKGEYQVQYRVALPDGTVRRVQEFAIAVKGPAGDLERFVGLVHDITAGNRFCMVS